MAVARQPSPHPTPSMNHRAKGPTRRLRRLKLAAAVLLLVPLVYLAVLVVTTPGVEQLRKASSARPSVIVSSDGEVIGRFADRLPGAGGARRGGAGGGPGADRHRGPPLLRARRPRPAGASLGSAWQTLKGDLQGGSTLTQQLARNLFPQRDRQPAQPEPQAARGDHRASASSGTATSGEILEAYLNTAPFLYNVRGFEMAAQTYFRRSAAELDTSAGRHAGGHAQGQPPLQPGAPSRNVRSSGAMSCWRRWHKRGVISAGRVRAPEGATARARFQAPRRRRDRPGAPFRRAASASSIVDWADASTTTTSTATGW